MIFIDCLKKREAFSGKTINTQMIDAGSTIPRQKSIDVNLLDTTK